MAITEITAETLGKKKSGWRWDKKREIYVSFAVDTTFDSKRHVKRGFLTEREAQDYIDQLKVQDRLKQIGVVSLVKYPTVKKLFTVHLEKISNKKSRVAANRAYTKFLSLLVPKTLKIDELKRKHFKDYVELRLSENVSAETANREITNISAALHKAGDYFAELENWQPPKIFRPVISDEGRNRVIGQDEWTAIVNYLLADQKADERPRDFKARRRTGLIFYFGLLTGLRHGEISGCLKSNFDRKRRRLKVERFKTKKSGIGTTIFEPLTETQIWVLSEAAKLYENGKYFFSEKGQPHHKFYKILKAACDNLGIEYGKNKANGLVMHDTRHTFVTTLEHGAIDSSTTRSFSGHSKDAMMKRYAHATSDSRARAMQIIEKQFGSGEDREEEELKQFFLSIKQGKTSFEGFKKTLESFSGFFAKTLNFDVQNVQEVQNTDSDFIQ